MNNYCLPIQKTSKAAVLTMIEQHERTYDYFEVWLDLIEDVDIDFLDSLISRLGSKFLIVFRRPQLEPIRLPLKTRLEFLQRLHSTDTYVDLDICSQAKELDYIAEHQLKIRSIISYHNYQCTPLDQHLYSLVETILEEHEPTIVKIATMCQNREDSLRLLQLLLFLDEKQRRSIVLGMGDHGLVTRVFGPLWGNELSFVPEDANSASAPGQLTRRKLKHIMKEMRG